jgi:hypothetical protein
MSTWSELWHPLNDAKVMHAWHGEHTITTAIAAPKGYERLGFFTSLAMFPELTQPCNHHVIGRNRETLRQQVRHTWAFQHKVDTYTARPDCQLGAIETAPLQSKG